MDGMGGLHRTWLAGWGIEWLALLLWNMILVAMHREYNFFAYRRGCNGVLMVNGHSK
jgi:hypothetical protein